MRHDGANATITTTLDSNPLYEWTGPTAALSQHSVWADATTEPGTLALGTSADGWAVSEVKVKRLEAGKKPCRPGVATARPAAVRSGSPPTPPSLPPPMLLLREKGPSPDKKVGTPDAPGCSLRRLGSSLHEMGAALRRMEGHPDAAGAEIREMGAAPGRNGGAPARGGVLPPPKGGHPAPSMEHPAPSGVSTPPSGIAPARNGGAAFPARIAAASGGFHPATGSAHPRLTTDDPRRARPAVRF